MKKCKICSLAIILILSISNSSVAQEIKLLKTTRFPHYPSASTIAIYNNRIYIIGDDAPYMLIVDTNHKVLDSTRLFSSTTKRINKEEKADIESSFLSNKSNNTYLVALSSFSTRKRNKYIVFNLTQKGKKAKIKNQRSLFAGGISEWNIEGATWIDRYLIMSNRANLSHKINHLLIVDFHLRRGIRQKKIKVIPITFPQEQAVTGISGLTYVEKTDVLLFTASTEKTLNSYDDGEIGESFLGIIENGSAKITGENIKPDTLLNLSKLFGNKSLQKIESIAVESDKEKYMIIHLAADNDNGESTLFKIQLKK
ncbi:MAG TPA: hypothetical protein VNA26_06845 [Chitinophagaceae bacterium]|nr:hypothetical protein [Chitinophagaceae bacterium]